MKKLAIISILNVYIYGVDFNQLQTIMQNNSKKLELKKYDINTTYTTSSTIDQYENEHRQIGAFTSNGDTYNINDVWFRVNKANTIDLNQVEISEDSFIKFININRFYKANSKLIA